MTLLRRLWYDDTAAIVSAEYVMLMGLATGGVAAGGVAVRNKVTEGFARVGDTLTAALPDPAAVRHQVASGSAQPAPAVAVSNVVVVYVTVPQSPSP